MAVLPHAHAVQAAGHDARPHAHGNWLNQLLAAVVDASDEHDSSHGHHHHSHGGHSHSHDEPQRAPVPVEPAGDNHDSTCVYLSDCGNVVPSSGSIADLTLELGQALFADGILGDVGNQTPTKVRRLPRPPDSLFDGCALLLKLRTLRI
jgi:hypothetical protein